MSSSTKICELKENEFKMIEDVRDKAKEFVFSDGCGFASPEIMNKVAKIFEFSQVSAIQMRFRGFKGVLMTHPGLGI